MNQLLTDVGGSTIAGKTVPRFGFGTMRLTGRGIWGPPDDRAECVAVLRRAVELGIRLIDTADSYGPFVAEEIIAEALAPYSDEVLIATKAGLTRNGPDVIDGPDGPKRLGPAAWPPVGRPEYLRQQALMSLRRLGLDHIDLFQLHRIDPRVPLEDQVGELALLQQEGKIVDIGLSQVTPDQLAAAQQVATIATVQSRFNVADRSSAEVLALCEAQGIGFIPFAPVAQGALPTDGALRRIADEHDATRGQVAIAWLLAVSPVTLPIAGTSKVAHLEENLRSASLRLTDAEVAELTDAA
ncbi:aldo/keto reductase [Amnibacterium setariae]|uniref:Aldo/keto reductase n=1 Tax=Amnibacterium setariae TaxID=2306585 RepID=A0A3A1TXX7_9MICO|nr:aldo/keto reductase [Amnibacterium setariae]RIX28620.1 aldo/keto reductase [Amnibacterium setariae]